MRVNGWGCVKDLILKELAPGWFTLILDEEEEGGVYPPVCFFVRADSKGLTGATVRKSGI